jgi:hypothetical protein
MRVHRGPSGSFPRFRAMEEEPPPVNRAHISVSPCLREKIQEGKFLYALALWLHPGGFVETR